MTRYNPVTLVCGFCSEDYTTTSNRSKYCSVRCSHNAHKRKRAFNIPRRMKDLADSSRRRAEKKGIPHNIDGEHLLGLWEDNGGKCCVTGVPFNLSYSDELQKGWSKKDAPSLDRIHPELGYTVGNVRLVAFQVNCAMGVYSDEDFYKMCELALMNRNKD